MIERKDKNGNAKFKIWMLHFLRFCNWKIDFVHLFIQRYLLNIKETIWTERTISILCSNRIRIHNISNITSKITKYAASSATIRRRKRRKRPYDWITTATFKKFKIGDSLNYFLPTFVWVWEILQYFYAQNRVKCTFFRCIFFT